MADAPRSSDPLSSPRRLASLAATRLMNTEKDEVFDRLTRLAASVLGVPVAAMSLLDAERQFIKSGVGLGDSRQGLVAHSFCQHAVRSREPFVVEDARVHPLAKDNPFVEDGSLVAYAGVPIMVDEGEAVGAFCIADAKPRKWTERELTILKDLSGAVEAQIAAHRAMIQAEERRQLLEVVLDTMGSGLMVMDADRKLTVINADAKRMIDEGALESPTHERPVTVGLYRADGQTHLLPEELPLVRAANGEVVSNVDIVVRPPKRPWTEYCVNVAARPLPAGGAVMVMHDMTERRALERKARMNEALYHKLAGNIPNALVYLIDRRFEILLAEGALFAKLDLNPAEIVGKSFSAVASPSNWLRTEAALRTCFEGHSASFTAIRADRTYEARCEPVYERADVVAAIMIYFDVTDRANEANELRTLTARLTALLEHMPEGVLFEDESFRVQLVNRAALEMFGVSSASALLGADIAAPASITTPGARSSFADPALAAYAMDEKRRAGERVLGERIELADGRILERDFIPVIDGGAHRGNLWMHRDVTERERTAARLGELSVRDELTGLVNRRGFIARGQKLLDAAESARRAPILFFVDLNGMKPINDQLGHHEGDRALVDTARLLEKAFDDDALIARLGGDEFVVLVPEPDGKSPTACERALKNTVAAFNDGCTRLYRVSVSVGYTEFDPHAPRTIEQLLNAADAQMYAAKRERQARGNVSLPPPTSKRG
ncbi:MAG: diguanylate cyclase [Labilithrix sp.]|nr:diguanylate cyclase [Labilithrix sp.]MCW5817807.1 diguanylate cyclase [Labilithrix sp.]